MNSHNWNAGEWAHKAKIMPRIRKSDKESVANVISLQQDTEHWALEHKLK